MIIDPSKIKANIIPISAAILAVHVYVMPCAVDEN